MLERCAGTGAGCIQRLNQQPGPVNSTTLVDSLRVPLVLGDLWIALGGLVLIGKAAVLKTAGSDPL